MSPRGVFTIPQTLNPGMICHPVMADAARSGAGAGAALITKLFALGQGHAPRRQHIRRPRAQSTVQLVGLLALNVPTMTVYTR